MKLSLYEQETILLYNQAEDTAEVYTHVSYLQFQRIGYFNIDKESTPDKLIFNRTVGLKDTWGKINK